MDVHRKAVWAAFILGALTSGCLQASQEPIACTLDAKICPDGTAVGRVPPNCEFAACPETKCTDGETREAACPDGITTYLSENCVNGTWAQVMYIRNPCEPLPQTSE